MLKMKQIDKLRSYRFDENMPVRVISYKLDISPTTVYKYLKMDNFTDEIRLKRKTRPRKTEPYESIIKEWLVEDKTRRYKQRHTARRIYDRLSEMFENFDVSYSLIAATVRKIKKEVYYYVKEYAPLRHLPGEAQVDMGFCEFVENGIKYDGCYVVMSFPYSNMAFCQLFKGRNTHSVLQGIKNIFEYIGGVPHEITIDNDSTLVRIVGTKKTKRIENDLFLRFKNHYDFKVRYCQKRAANEKGHVEGKVGYLRRNLFVPVPQIDNLDEYNKYLLEQCMIIHDRKHSRAESKITEMFIEETDALLSMPEQKFEVVTCCERVVDKAGRVKFQNSRIYYLKPDYALRKVKVKYDYKQIYFYNNNDELIVRLDRLYGKDYTAINWVDWLPTVMRKPNSLFNSALTDKFSDSLKMFLLSGPSKVRSLYMKALTELTKNMSLEYAIEIAERAAEQKKETYEEVMALQFV